jgi:type II restriction/modification system DNA methylase subunit YeeA
LGAEKMDKKVLKEFAIMARKELRDEVTLKANTFGLSENDNCEIYIGSDYVKINGNTYPKTYEKAYRKLIEIKQEKGFDELIEEVSYTWFNRFIAIRFMEANDYLPSHIRVLSSEVEGKVDPDILEQYKECDLDVDTNEIDLLISNGNTEGAYRKLLIAQCNKLSKMMPFLFEEINDYTEMLLPDKLLIPQSIIKKLVNTISEDDFREQVEIIGWIYQYYISEKKDEVFADLKKNIKISKENIPAATQLFTPDWIVKYMVENSLGRLWLEGHTNKELQSSWKYYLEEAEQEPEVLVELQKIAEEHSKLTPEDIKVLDPCMGSGHILVYAFDVLYQIYLSAGYQEKYIPRLILEKNIYGLDIDDRAAQLAGFALVMKARSYSKRLFRDIEKNPLELNVCAIQESRTLDEKGEKQISGITEEEIKYFANGDVKLKDDLEYLVEVFTDAKEYGSIIEVEEVNFEALKERLKEIEQEENFMFGDYRKMLLDKLPAIIKQAEIMSRKYEVCATNPPYMGNKGINDKLKVYIGEKFPMVKADVFSVYVGRNYAYTKDSGYLGFMTPFVWMFISSYEDLRKNIICNKTIQSLIQLEYSGFDEATVPICTFVLRNCKTKVKSEYIRLSDFKGAYNQPIKTLEAIKNPNIYYRYHIINDKFLNIPGYPIAYWVSNNVFRIYSENTSISEIGKACKGIDTGNNDIFLRLWHEVNAYDIGINLNEYKCAINSSYKYYPYNKGGGFRKWYGNNEYVILWDDNGKKIRNYKKSNLRNKNFYRKDGLTWSTVTSSKFSIREFGFGYYFDNGGSCLFIDNKRYYLALLNSTIFNMLQKLSPTLNFQPGDIGKVPVIFSEEHNKHICTVGQKCICISKLDWDSFETSWDFKVHPLLKLLDKGDQHKLSSIFNMWKTECEENFNQLKHNEEELNKIFIDIYGFQDELTPNVDDKDITIRKADRERDIKSFISYAVGCMLGRYSIDSEGLIYAGGDIKYKWNLEEKKVRKIDKHEDGNIISDSWVETTFLPDSDNVIPITENEYFENDIVSRFIDFVKTVYGEETLNENVDFIAETLVKKNNETSRERIRRYFMDEFFIDHCKVYQKRPIYWLIDSGKNKGFRTLIYLHRYNKETLANVRLNYLLELQGKYINEEKQIERYLDNGTLTSAEKKKYTKELQMLSQKQNELVSFDKVLDELANNKEINLELDDGVVENYKKLQPILAKIK